MNTSRKVRESLLPILNHLNINEGISVVDINAAMFGLITRSLEEELGIEDSREFIESAMLNVWGKKKMKLFGKKQVDLTVLKRDIIVNGNQVVFPRASITFEEVCYLSGFEDFTDPPTVTYRHRGAHSIGNGILAPGDSISLPYELTIFNAVFTGNA